MLIDEYLKICPQIMNIYIILVAISKMSGENPQHWSLEIIPELHQGHKGKIAFIQVCVGGIKEFEKLAVANAIRGIFNVGIITD